MEVRPGFKPDELKARYDVEAISEDDWHSYSGRRTATIVNEHLAISKAKSRLLLNAGAGVHQIGVPPWEEVAVDLFVTPMRAHRRTVCASIEDLPFPPNQFGAVVCVGEVLGYCDPGRAIAEFGRVIEPRGVLVCDFGNSRSIRHWLTPTHRRAADLTTDIYNGSPERIWVYDGNYVRSLLAAAGFEIVRILGTHTWSALSRKIGATSGTAVRWQRRLDWMPFPTAWADIITIVASRSEAGPELSRTASSSPSYSQRGNRAMTQPGSRA